MLRGLSFLGNLLSVCILSCEGRLFEVFWCRILCGNGVGAMGKTDGGKGLGVWTGNVSQLRVLQCSKWRIG